MRYHTILFRTFRSTAFCKNCGAILLCTSINTSIPAIASPPTPCNGQLITASYYHESLDGNLTASGTPYYHYSGYTVAHRTLPFGTLVKFSNPQDGTAVVAEVNDRGPFIDGREFDFSGGTAQAMNMLDKNFRQQKGLAKVCAEVY